MRDSNSQPIAYKAIALPIEPTGQRFGRAVAFLLSCAASFLCAAPTASVAASSPETLVSRAALTLESLLEDNGGEILQDWISQAKGVFILPQIIKGGLFLGAEVGKGVVLVRGADNSWSPPAFFDLRAASLGIQAGAKAEEAVLAIMKPGAIDALLANRLKLGVDASIAAGPLGRGLQASATTNFSNDIYTFSRAVGLFGGAAFQGGLITFLPKENTRYYGQAVTPEAILIERLVDNPQADALRKLLP